MKYSAGGHVQTCTGAARARWTDRYYTSSQTCVNKWNVLSALISSCNCIILQTASVQSDSQARTMTAFGPHKHLHVQRRSMYQYTYSHKYNLRLNTFMRLHKHEHRASSKRTCTHKGNGNQSWRHIYDLGRHLSWSFSNCTPSQASHDSVGPYFQVLVDSPGLSRSQVGAVNTHLESPETRYLLSRKLRGKMHRRRQMRISTMFAEWE